MLLCVAVDGETAYQVSYYLDYLTCTQVHDWVADATWDWLQLIHDELSLDGNPLLNLASFVHTHMDPGADKLMDENKNKASNLVE